MGFYDTFNSYGHIVSMTGQEIQVPQLHSTRNVSIGHGCPHYVLVTKTKSPLTSRYDLDLEPTWPKVSLCTSSCYGEHLYQISKSDKAFARYEADMKI